ENTQDSTQNQPVENENSTPEENIVNTPSELAEDYKVETHDEEAEEVENVEEEIPFKNYDDFSVEILIGEAKDLLAKHPARKLREHFNQIRDAVKRKLEEEETIKRDAFIEEGGEAADFHYDN